MIFEEGAMLDRNARVSRRVRNTKDTGRKGVRSYLPQLQLRIPSLYLRICLTTLFSQFCLVVPFHGPPMIRILKHAACLSWGLPLTVRSFLPGSTNGIEGYPRAAWMPELCFAIQTRSLSVQLPTFLSMKENRNA
ncbi:hypothetical protein NMY22_g19597 [Coprinellus aureogranulatus]|nr:hypothetical protein NMY22_g19597 [Coprinellus aureogranulatus]